MIEDLYPDEDLFPGPNVYPSDNTIVFNSKLKYDILEKLKKIRFNNPNEILNNYFLQHGLIYAVNKQKIYGVENILKVVDMFKRISMFTEENYNEIEKIANEIYYNNGNNDLNNININCYDTNKLINHINNFDFVFTTNYDTILDDILEKNEKNHIICMEVLA
jgi:hypothetical protein